MSDVSHLPVQPLDALFAALEAAREPRPRITVHLASGHSFSGEFVQYRHDTVMMHVEHDATYFPLAAVRALTVHQPAVPVERAPRRNEIDLTLRGVMELVSRSLGQNIPATIEWDRMTISDELLAALQALVGHLQPVFTAIGNDAMAGPALLRIKKLDVSAGATPQVAVQGATLRLQLGVQGARVQGFDRDSLQKAIENAL